MSYTQPIIHQAFDLALTALRNQYRKRGIEAGEHHFSDLWARDSLYASFGSLAVGDITIVKTNLSTLLTYQRKDGAIPLRVGQKHFLLKYIGITGKTQARFIDDKNTSLVMDSNPLLLIVLGKYLRQTKDMGFYKRYKNRIEKTVQFMRSQVSEDCPFIYEGPYAGWADSLKKRGFVSYTNVLYFAALTHYKEILEITQQSDKLPELTETIRSLKLALNEHFWTGHYYRDWIHEKETMDVFSTDANVFAILFGLTTQAQSKKILNHMKAHGLNHKFTTATHSPDYPSRSIYPPFFLLNMADYHNGLDWLWVGCMDAVAKAKSGDKAAALVLLQRQAAKIIEYEGVYEVYDKGVPVNRFFYKSEVGFAWSSGLFVWACCELGLVKPPN